jgi:hypothetical protein
MWFSYILRGFWPISVCAVFEQGPVFPGVIFCKIYTQSLTKGYTHGHLNAHVKSDKTADHRLRPTIKNSVTPFETNLTCSRWSRRVWSSLMKWPWVTWPLQSFEACWQSVCLARLSTGGQMPSTAALGCSVQPRSARWCVIYRQRRAKYRRRCLSHNVLTSVLLIGAWRRLKKDESFWVDKQLSKF